MVNRSVGILLFFDSCATNNLTFVVEDVAVVGICSVKKSRFDIELNAFVDYRNDRVTVAVDSSHFAVSGNHGTPLFELARPRVDKWRNLTTIAIDKAVAIPSAKQGNSVVSGWSRGVFGFAIVGQQRRALRIATLVTIHVDKVE